MANLEKVKADLAGFVKAWGDSSEYLTKTYNLDTSPLMQDFDAVISSLQGTDTDLIQQISTRMDETRRALKDASSALDDAVTQANKYASSI